jgi:hypothetical protein
MTKTKLSTSLTLPIELTYTLLPAEHGLPMQVDILSAYIEVKGKQDKPRKIQLLSTLDESEILQLEDMVFDSLE